MQAIERTLTAEGLDIHDLTAALTNGTQTPPSTTVAQSASHREISSDGLLELIIKIRGQSRLSQRSIDFLRSLEDRAMHYDKMFLTEKQIGWLMDLASRAGVAFI